MQSHFDPVQRDKRSACFTDEKSIRFHPGDLHEWAGEYLGTAAKEASARLARPVRAIRLSEVLSMVGCSKSHWYSMADARSRAYDPAVPKSFKLGRSERSPTVWWQHEIEQYLEHLAEARCVKQEGRHG